MFNIPNLDDVWKRLDETTAAMNAMGVQLETVVDLLKDIKGLLEDNNA